VVPLLRTFRSRYRKFTRSTERQQVKVYTKSTAKAVNSDTLLLGTKDPQTVRQRSRRGALFASCRGEQKLHCHAFEVSPSNQVSPALVAVL